MLLPPNRGLFDIGLSAMLMRYIRAAPARVSLIFNIDTIAVGQLSGEHRIVRLTAKVPSPALLCGTHTRTLSRAYSDHARTAHSRNHLPNPSARQPIHPHRPVSAISLFHSVRSTRRGRARMQARAVEQASLPQCPLTEPSMHPAQRSAPVPPVRGHESAPVADLCKS